MSLGRGLTPHNLFGLLPLTKAFPPSPLHPHLGLPLERKLISMARNHLAGVVVVQRLPFAYEGGGLCRGLGSSNSSSSSSPYVATSPAGLDGPEGGNGDRVRGPARLQECVDSMETPP